MTGVELTEEEVALLDEAAAATILAVANDMSTTEEVLNAVAQIIEARLAVMNEAAVAAIRAEAENHRLEAEVERLTAERDEYERRYDTAKFQAALAEDRAAKFEALVEAGLGLIRAEADKYDHPNQWVARDLLHSVANRVAALGGAK